VRNPKLTPPAQNKRDVGERETVILPWSDRVSPKTDGKAAAERQAGGDRDQRKSTRTNNNMQGDWGAYRN